MLCLRESHERMLASQDSMEELRQRVNSTLRRIERSRSLLEKADALLQSSAAQTPD
ncbi:MAG TPA: hypothetical protein VG225_13905 [Terracidiphilus sp.]|jgi:hypothetical protein|nr:hypothetical protein [Terracidiphilus sp.]